MSDDTEFNKKLSPTIVGGLNKSPVSLINGEQANMGITGTGSDATILDNVKSNDEVDKITRDIIDVDDVMPSLNKTVGIKTYAIKKKTGQVTQWNNSPPSQSNQEKVNQDSDKQSTMEVKNQNKIVLVKLFPSRNGNPKSTSGSSFGSNSNTSTPYTSPSTHITHNESISTYTNSKISNCEVIVEPSILDIKKEDQDGDDEDDDDDDVEDDDEDDDEVEEDDEDDDEEDDDDNEVEEDEDNLHQINNESIIEVKDILNDKIKEASSNKKKLNREIKSLNKTQNESKILTEYANDSCDIKSRKSRKLSAQSSTVTPAGKRSKSRSPSFDRTSCSSSLDKSTSSVIDSATKTSSNTSLKRQNMRSQNLEFSLKQQKFLSRIQNQSQDSEATDISEDDQNFTIEDENNGNTRVIHPPPKPNWDKFCWRCHQDGPMNPCTKCLRSYHPKCLKNSQAVSKTPEWLCPECINIEMFEKSNRVDNENLDHLCTLLRFSLKRMMQLKGCQDLIDGPNLTAYPDYKDYVTQYMDLSLLQNNIQAKKYHSTEAFAADTKWIQHNYTIYPEHNKHLGIIKSLMKICRQELNEIETCSECYYNANTRKDWFIAVCNKPHILLWAKLKGFPYWPAKGMGINSNGLADVRFFGEHDRAWVPVRDCFLYSEKDPNTTNNKKRNNIVECIKEANVHIQKLVEIYGSFNYAPFRTPYDPVNESVQLRLMIPNYDAVKIKTMTETKEESVKKTTTSTTSSPTVIPKNSDSESKLKLKIIKTADNNLSVVTNSNQTKKNSNEDSSNKLGSEQIIATKLTKRNVIKMRKEELNLPPEKLKILGKNGLDGGPKTYQILRKNTSNEDISTEVNIAANNIITQNTESVNTSSMTPPPHSKLETVIIKRKSDNWKTVPQSIKKMRKSLDVNTTNSNKNINEQLDVSSSDDSYLRESETISEAQSVETLKIKIPKSHVTIQEKISNNIKPITALSTITKTTMLPLQSKKQPIIISTTKLFNERDELNNPQSSAEQKDPQKSTKDELTAAIDMLPQISIICNKQSEKVHEKGVDNEGQQETSLIRKASNGELNNENKRVLRSRSKSARKDSGPSSADVAETHKFNKTLTNTNYTVIMNSSPEMKITNLSKSIPSTENNGRSSVAGSKLINAEDIKIEPSSDDGDYSDTPSNTENENELTVTKIMSANKSTNDITDRISVKDISKLTNIDNFSNKNKSILTPVERHIKKNFGVGCANKIKPIQRARKSFPNKMNITPAMLMPNNLVHPRHNAYNNLKNATNMVYIPMNYNLKNTINLNGSDLPSSSNISGKTTNDILSLPSATPATSTGHTMPGATGANEQIVSLVPIFAAQKNSSSLAASTISSSPSITPTNSASPVNQNDPHIMAGLITKNLAAAVTDTIVGGPPKLVPRPNGALRSNGDSIYPSEAGPLSQNLVNNSYKIADFFRSVIEDTLLDLANNGTLEAKVKILEIEIEKMKFNHAKELAQLKHNSDLVLSEMRNSLEQEKLRIISDTRKQCEIERIKSVEEIKKKQWCVNCGREAKFYCCWNTSYCDYPCQKIHWTQHMPECSQHHMDKSINMNGVAQVTKTLINCRTINNPGNKPANNSFSSIQR